MGAIGLEYGSDAALEDLLRSVDRPGDFCVHGRLYAPMPTLEVEGVGMLAFPVPETQIHPDSRIGFELDSRKRARCG